MRNFKVVSDGVAFIVDDIELIDMIELGYDGDVERVCICSTTPDKNGRLICEQDILSVPLSSDGLIVTAPVQFDGGSLWCDGLPIDEINLTNAEVIGDEILNPEML